jgi:hypothetical protein
MKPKRTKKVKARTYYVDALPKKRSDAPPICTTQDALTPNAISILPRTKEAAEAMVSQLAKVLRRADIANYDPESGPGIHYYSHLAECSLRSLGLLP